jgi:hypothetical protein
MVVVRMGALPEVSFDLGQGGQSLLIGAVARSPGKSV